MTSSSFNDCPFPVNAMQKQAVMTTEGKVLVLAGAGSGKTSALVSRIAYLIQYQKVDPEAILGLTFTNKAAAEMRERVARYVEPDQALKIELSTFHSFCFHLLKKEIHRLGFTAEFTIYDEKDIKRLCESIAKQLLEHEVSKLPSLDSTLNEIKKLKQQVTLPDTPSKSWHEEFSRTLFTTLDDCLRAYNALDFDNLIRMTLKLFHEHPDVLDIYRKKFRYIMIDEYQDTNPMQYELARLLSSYHHNLCVVGDDDQSIYGWRGAAIEHILHFDYDCLIKLEQNYRSTQSILNAANAVIANNQVRHAKTLWTDNCKGPTLDIFHAPDEEKEAEAVVGRLIKLKQTLGLKWKDCAILYRSNSLARPFELALLAQSWFDGTHFRKGIPYHVAMGTEFYERSEIKDLLAYLRVIVNPHDQEALLRIINFPRRGISTQTLDIMTRLNRTEKCSLWSLITHPHQLQLLPIPPKALQAIGQFVSLIHTAKEQFNHKPLGESFDWLIDTIGYKKVIQEETSSDKGEKFRLENLQQFRQLLTSYQETEPQANLDGFIHGLLLNARATDFKNESAQDKVNLLTFHSAKGLEFELCFIVGLEDHILPHEKSILESGIEEERRLFYVALTRAKQHLCLSMSRNRKRMGKITASTPSRFLFEIPKELIQPSMWNLY
jgi:superfamily I DNA/RNA helicase